MLFRHYLAEAAKELDSSPKSIDNEALELLETYDWPGNVRQLVNATRRLTVTAPGAVITAQDIPADFGGQSAPARGPQEWTRQLAAWAQRQIGAIQDLAFKRLVELTVHYRDMGIRGPLRKQARG